ncbi:MAG: transposase [Archangiaceae bacterium]|nr:transposase [Archangiaceae bacterium]
MMAKRKRRNFTPEFKAEAVKQLVEEKRPVSQVAKALGIWETRSRAGSTRRKQTEEEVRPGP